MKEYRLTHLLGTTPPPIVSVLNGITIGGGVGLSLLGGDAAASRGRTALAGG